MEEKLIPKSYTPDLEIKSQIIYESLCENYGISLIEDVFKLLKIEKIELSDDNIAKRILDILNGNI